MECVKPKLNILGIKGQGLLYFLNQKKFIPGDSGGQESAQFRSTGFDPWVRKIPWRREWQPTPVLLPGEIHGRKSLEGYSPWCHKKSDMTRWLSLSLTTPSTFSHQVEKNRKSVWQGEAAGTACGGMYQRPDFWKRANRGCFVFLIANNRWRVWLSYIKMRLLEMQDRSTESTGGQRTRFGKRSGKEEPWRFGRQNHGSAD